MLVPSTKLSAKYQVLGRREGRPCVHGRTNRHHPWGGDATPYAVPGAERLELRAKGDVPFAAFTSHEAEERR
jgi:hypothetical protein